MKKILLYISLMTLNCLLVDVAFARDFKQDTSVDSTSTYEKDGTQQDTNTQQGTFKDTESQKTKDSPTVNIGSSSSSFNFDTSGMFIRPETYTTNRDCTKANEPCNYYDFNQKSIKQITNNIPFYISIKGQPPLGQCSGSSCRKYNYLIHIKHPDRDFYDYVKISDIPRNCYDSSFNSNNHPEDSLNHYEYALTEKYGKNLPKNIKDELNKLKNEFAKLSFDNNQESQFQKSNYYTYELNRNSATLLPGNQDILLKFIPHSDTSNICSRFKTSDYNPDEGWVKIGEFTVGQLKCPAIADSNNNVNWVETNGGEVAEVGQNGNSCFTDHLNNSGSPIRLACGVDGNWNANSSNLLVTENNNGCEPPAAPQNCPKNYHPQSNSYWLESSPGTYSIKQGQFIPWSGTALSVTSTFINPNVSKSFYLVTAGETQVSYIKNSGCLTDMNFFAKISDVCYNGQFSSNSSCRPFEESVNIAKNATQRLGGGATGGPDITRVCNSNGVWDAPIGKCKIKTCPFERESSTDIIWNATSAGYTSVFLTSEDGVSNYTALGSAKCPVDKHRVFTDSSNKLITRKCNDDGTWEPSTGGYCQGLQARSTMVTCNPYTFSPSRVWYSSRSVIVPSSVFLSSSSYDEKIVTNGGHSTKIQRIYENSAERCFVECSYSSGTTSYGLGAYCEDK